MRKFLLPLLGLLVLQPAARAADESNAEKDIRAVIQKLWDSMGAHDGAAIQATMTPDARLALANDKGIVLNVNREEFAARFEKSPADRKMLERTWGEKVFIRGRIATVWAEYDVHVNGKFTHCGIDSFLLLNGPDGWRIFSIVSTMEPTGCAPSPMGPPKM